MVKSSESSSLNPLIFFLFFFFTFFLIFEHLFHYCWQVMGERSVTLEILLCFLLPVDCLIKYTYLVLKF